MIDLSGILWAACTVAAGMACAAWLVYAMKVSGRVFAGHAAQRGAMPEPHARSPAASPEPFRCPEAWSPVLYLCDENWTCLVDESEEQARYTWMATADYRRMVGDRQGRLAQR